MISPMQEIETYLADTHTPECRQLEVAVAYAERMVRELQPILLDWERTVAQLRQIDHVRKDALTLRN